MPGNREEAALHWRDVFEQLAGFAGRSLSCNFCFCLADCVEAISRIDDSLTRRCIYATCVKKPPKLTELSGL